MNPFTLRGLGKVSSGSLPGKLLRAPLALIPSSTVVTVRSGINAGFKWTVGSSVHGCWLGHYEADKQDVVGSLVAPGMLVFDIGANAGFYTLAFSRLVGERGKVVAFEPLAENVHSLRRHLSLNGITNVTVVQSAVAGAQGLAGFAEAASNSMGHLSEPNSYIVPTVSIDDARARLGLGVPSLIKIDVEGAEAAVLEGARQTLAERKSVILLATHGPEPERQCVSILRGLGYELRYFDGTPAVGERLLSDELIAAPSGAAFQPTAASLR